MSLAECNPISNPLEEQLNSMDSYDRAEALCCLAQRLNSHEIDMPAPTREVNLHLHTFFSYRTCGWSPSRVAWEARKRGLLVAGITDSNVIDGIEEFLTAGEIIQLPTTAALETKAFVSDCFDRIINCSGEPGMIRFAAMGCIGAPPADTPADEALQIIRKLYIAPEQKIYPSLEQAVDLACAMGALPTLMWPADSCPDLDTHELFAFLADRGIAALSIILNKQHSFESTACLTAAIEAAQEIGFPICMGTDIDNTDIPSIGDYIIPEIEPYVDEFIDGAHCIWGHTALARNVGMGYGSEWAQHYFGDDRHEKKQFYTHAGRIVSPHETNLLIGSNLRSGSPAQVMRALQG